jgi:putative membrane protein
MKFVARSAWLVLYCAVLLLPAAGQINQESPNTRGPISGGPPSGPHKYPMKPGPGMPASELRFLDNTAQRARAEIELGKMATQKAAEPSVKEFGQRMVGNYSKLLADLEAMGSDNGFSLPSGMQPVLQSTKQQLSQLSGRQFDTAYIQAMVAGQQQAVSNFKTEAYDAKSEIVKGFAGRYLPMVADQLYQGRGIAAKLDISTGK